MKWSEILELDSGALSRKVADVVGLAIPIAKGVANAWPFWERITGRKQVTWDNDGTLIYLTFNSPAGRFEIHGAPGEVADCMLRAYLVAAIGEIEGEKEEGNGQVEVRHDND